MTNINFIISKYISGSIETLDVIAPDNVISTSDINVLNIAVQGFETLQAGYGVEITFTLPDGSKIEKYNLVASSSNTNLFSATIDHLFDGLEIGDVAKLTIDQIKVYNLGKSWSSTEKYYIDVTKVSETKGYNPTDIDRLFIAVNDLQKQINKLKV